MSRLLLISLLTAVCVSLAPTANAAPSARTNACWSGYSYAGVQSPARGYGVSATLKMSSPSAVGTGHVAAWIGVGGAGLGPGGSDEWVQAGIARDAGGAAGLYYEFKRPGDASATFVPLGAAVQGQAYSFVVYERAGQRDAWRVMLNGVKVSDPIALPGSHGAFQPVATAENWDGGVAGGCNAYGFSFASLAIRTQFAGAWNAFNLSRVLLDPAYALSMRASGFTASSR